MIIADTGAIIALVDRKDRHHRALVEAYEASADEWLLPWAILPEVDYLLGAHVGIAAQDAFLADLAEGAYAVAWGEEEDLDDAARITRQYRSLRLGLVDAVVMALAGRRRARAIVTLDVRHFASVTIPGAPQLWPRVTLVWSIAYNTELVKNPPKTWMDLTKPEYDKLTGQVIAPSGGTTWTRVMFERQVLGEDYWAKQAATHPVLYPSGAPMSDSLVRGEIAMGPLLYNAIYPKQKDGAPIQIFFPPEGAPVNPYATGIPKTAAHPNAAKLFLNWCLSKEGQTFMIKELGNLTSLKVPPAYPDGFDPKVVKVWFPKFDEYVKLQAAWVSDWNKTYGYGQ